MEYHSKYGHWEYAGIRGQRGESVQDSSLVIAQILEKVVVTMIMGHGYFPHTKHYAKAIQL